MESTVYLNTTLKALRAALTAQAVPEIVCKLQAALSIEVKPFATGDAEAALFEGTPTFRAVIKKDPTDTGYVFTSTVVENEAGDGYVVSWESVDSAGLRTDLGDAEYICGTFEFEWTLDGEVERATCPVMILNAWIRSDEEAPEPGADESGAWLSERAVRYDEAQSLTNAQAAQALANMKLTITAGGYVRMVNAAGDVFHFGLNSGEPPG